MPLPQHYTTRSGFAAYLILILSTFCKKMLPGIQPYNLDSHPTETTILRKQWCIILQWILAQEWKFLSQFINFYCECFMFQIFLWISWWTRRWIGILAQWEEHYKCPLRDTPCCLPPYCSSGTGFYRHLMLAHIKLNTLYHMEHCSNVISIVSKFLFIVHKFL